MVFPCSLDWYNLEKSKRVKAFRCGEYDECIEKAKAGAAHNSKKAARYARREDAILHALEIESASLENSKIDKEDGVQSLVEESPISPHPREESENIDKDSNNSEDYSSSDPELSESDAPFEEATTISASKDSEDDGTRGGKRMRGLDDLGSTRVVVQSAKRKRSQTPHVREFLKKKIRRRRLMKVLESTAMVSVPVVCEDLPSPNGPDLAGVSDSKEMLVNSTSDDTGVLCENGTPINAIPSISGSPENGVLERSLFDVPFVTEEKHSAGLSPIVSLASQVGAGEKASQSGQAGTMSLGDGEFNEPGSRSLDNTEIHDFSPMLEKETSKWQSKGKRNSRHTRQTQKSGSGKTMGMNDESDTCLAELQVDEFQGWSRNISPRETLTKGRTAEVSNPQRLLPYRHSRFTVNPKYESSDFSLRHHRPVESSLYEVNLEVKSSYRPQYVPYISLVSKLNGRPITGHPVTVEVLDEGFCSQLLMSTSECYSSSYDNIPEDPSEPSSCGKALRLHPRGSPTAKSSKSKKNAVLSKKMRKLSSLTGSHKQSHEKKGSVQKLFGPVVACVPLKVVFSRINEALNSSARRITGTSNG